MIISTRILLQKKRPQPLKRYSLRKSGCLRKQKHNPTINKRKDRLSPVETADLIIYRKRIKLSIIR